MDKQPTTTGPSRKIKNKYALNPDDWNELIANGQYTYHRNPQGKRERRYIVIGRNYDQWNQITKESIWALSKDELELNLHLEIPRRKKKHQSKDTRGSTKTRYQNLISKIKKTSGTTYQKKDGKA